MDGGMIWRLVSIVLAFLLAVRGYRKRSLDRSGAISAFLVGLLHMGFSLAAGSTLIFFYLSSSMLTKVQSERKATLEDDFKHGGQRNAVQVLANSLGACLSLATLSFLTASQGWSEAGEGTLHRTASIFCVGAFLGHYSCCCSDTWASEIGILSSSSPRLITSFRKVPAGTNGGVTMLGSVCTLAAGVAIGLVYYCATYVEYLYARWVWSSAQAGSPAPAAPMVGGMLLLSITTGIFGCELDSLLGATLQYSGFDEAKKKVVGQPGKNVKHICGLPLLSNSAVNLISAAASALVGGVIALQIAQRNWL